jgi:hypothetical protein
LSTKNLHSTALFMEIQELGEDQGQTGGQKLHLRPGSIDQNGIHIGLTPDMHRTYTIPPRLGVAGGDEIS